MIPSDFVFTPRSLSIGMHAQRTQYADCSLCFEVRTVRTYAGMTALQKPIRIPQ